MTPIEKLLKESELFSGLSDASAKKIASMGKITKVPQNTMIFLEGEKGSSFFIMVEGSVRLFKSAPDGREVTVKLASPGEIFAEVVLFEKDRYPVSATALADSVLFSMSRPVFETLLDNAEFRDDFISVLMKKQRYLAGRILYLAAYDVEERFFRFLADHYGKLQSYEITLSKKDFASAIGTIPETFSRLLQRLTSRRIIQWEGNRLTLPDDFWDRQYDD
ncbi:MAG TPA: Crp/Fnr family transcriptional regulator [Spirochaetota bacterium]|nr:Crp/Fnr family transcriptional regulator [Spirochaetota bacterium]HPL15664.1 Crp/Fnr family transcriptional regulator [Spirochaetota bacterium]HQF09289.1 Crp/Fnr family transcriptional regulator [Spirochaetota bacterium]HQH98237.1 Crp/Fnr family transcriptional regulator [Spirochaetota bacterium]HQJ70396.1 Crp/Fnr family transcriptional regulator [Spirochaetota bacterium]